MTNKEPEYGVRVGPVDMPEWDADGPIDKEDLAIGKEVVEKFNTKVEQDNTMAKAQTFMYTAVGTLSTIIAGSVVIFTVLGIIPFAVWAFKAAF